MTGDFPTDRNDLADGYQVCVKGYLSEDILAWLDLTGSYDRQLDVTFLWVATTDQAALYGLLNRLRDLGLTLIIVRPHLNQSSWPQTNSGGTDDSI